MAHSQAISRQLTWSFRSRGPLIKSEVVVAKSTFELVHSSSIANSYKYLICLKDVVCRSRNFHLLCVPRIKIEIE